MRPTLKLLVACALSALSAACAEDGTVSLSDRLAGSSRVKGDAETVRVFQASSRADAFPLAIGHCARFGKSAQYDSLAEGAYVFRCVKG